MHPSSLRINSILLHPTLCELHKPIFLFFHGLGFFLRLVRLHPPFSKMQIQYKPRRQQVIFSLCQMPIKPGPRSSQLLAFIDGHVLHSMVICIGIQPFALAACKMGWSLSTDLIRSYDLFHSNFHTKHELF